MIALKILLFLLIYDCVLLQGSEPKKNGSVILPALTVSTGISNVIPTKEFQSVKSDLLTTSYPTEEKEALLTVAASKTSAQFVGPPGFAATTQKAGDSHEQKGFCTGVIIFIVILVVIVIILVSMVSLRFRCQHCKKAKDKQKPQHSIVSYSCSDADTTVGKKNVLLVSIKDLNTTSSKSPVKAITLEEQEGAKCLQL